uniref:Uncharacterized protein n=1 Tax=Nelumbo nucifera TaxID=4432 RepID=A0A822YR08_NELNU|nr:TPA_asm: hypothetical protein HUJ06_004641 [Nelumbo nucifera]DAD34379.1 TPA_asm: hypothetical protein HUJ06_005019 [Nelumbo nucifera]
MALLFISNRSNGSLTVRSMIREIKVLSENPTC